MKKIIAIAALLFLALTATAQTILFIGKSNSSWILIDLWDNKYFYNKAKLTEHDQYNLASLKPEKEEQTRAYLVDKACKTESEECIIDTLSAANILLLNGEIEHGLKLISSTKPWIESTNACPIHFETSLLLYKLITLSKHDYPSEEAQATLEKIKTGKGLVFALNSLACKKLANDRPQLFHNYTLFISNLMTHAGGAKKIAGIYIQSIDNTTD